MIWGMGAVFALSAIAWSLRSPDEGPMGRAVTVLALYGALFLGSLLKIWWTAGRPAVVLTPSSLAYQQLHRFKPRHIPIAGILACAPRPGTQSLQLVVEEARGAREVFLNLAVVGDSHRFLELLAARLSSCGLEPRPADSPWCASAWRRPGYDEPAAAGAAGEKEAGR
jgi:hypothetical protein